MIKEQQQRVVGKLISVHTNKGVVELTQNVGNFIVSGFDDIHRFAQINSYVVIPYQNNFIIGEVLGIREASPSNKNDNDDNKVIVPDDVLDINFIGELKLNHERKYKFQFGITTYPPLYSDVLYIKDDELDIIFKVDEGEISDSFDNTKTRPKTLKIGTSSVFPDYDVKIDIESFFSKHIAVLGNTGSGKSCTISSIMQSLYEKKSFAATGSTFIVLDTNGEYLQALEDLENNDIKILHLSSENGAINEAGNVKYEKFFLPHWFLNFDEWALLLQASEKVQLPVLRSAISLGQIFKSAGAEKIKYTNHILARCVGQIMASDQGAVSKAQRIKQLLDKYGTDKINNNLDAFKFDQYGKLTHEADFDTIVKDCTLEDPKIPNPQKIAPFDLETLEEILDLAILYEESYGRSNIRNFCSSLQLRAQNLLSRADFEFLKASTTSFKEYLFKLMGISESGGQIKKTIQIIIIDLSMYQDEIIEVISSVLSRILFEGLQRAKPRNEYPVHIIIEEAHRYISEKDSENVFQAKKIFERIAKEGRKYGMSLIISSQRPSELSKTVLSQCSNYIVHRIMNPEDLLYIKRMTPYISEEILNELPYVPRQQALIFGSAVNMPMMFKVREARPKPKSDDNEITKHWYKEPNYNIALNFGDFDISSNPAKKTDSIIPKESVDVKDIPF